MKEKINEKVLEEFCRERKEGRDVNDAFYLACETARIEGDDAQMDSAWDYISNHEDADTYS